MLLWSSFCLEVFQVRQKNQLCLFQLSILLPSALMEIFLKSLVSFFLIYSNWSPPPPLVFSTLPTQRRRGYLLAFLLSPSAKNATSPYAYRSHNPAQSRVQLPCQSHFFFPSMYILSCWASSLGVPGWSTALPSLLIQDSRLTQCFITNWAFQTEPSLLRNTSKKAQFTLL